MTERPIATDRPSPAADPYSAGPNPGSPTPIPRHAVLDEELALRLPGWDLVPPTEFIRRQPLR